MWCICLMLEPMFLESNETVIQFNKAKDALVSSIVSLSPNSYFNLVLYWNLREVAALGKTILKASSENKKYAIDWISSLGDTKESIKSDRNQYYPKRIICRPCTWYYWTLVWFKHCH